MTSRFSLLSNSERQQLLRGWNATSRDLPIETLAGMFERQAFERSDQVAVADGISAVTYDALSGTVR